MNGGRRGRGRRQHRSETPSVNVQVWAPGSRLTVFNTRLSSGFLLGSLVEERIPVPQLLASVFLWKPQQAKQMRRWAPGDGCGNHAADVLELRL